MKVAAGPPTIRAEGLSFAYRRSGGAGPVLAGLAFGIEPGEYMVLAGASGSGKSTLCRTFNGLIPHFYGGRMTGEVRVAGRPVAGLGVADLFDRVGTVFQNPDAQLFNRSVASEIAFGLESLGLRAGEIRARMGGAAKTLGITRLLGRAPALLSGGEKQLVAIAAVLALAPDLIVLDEPYANLDPSNSRRIRRAVADIHLRGTGIVICEHRMGLTLPDAGRVMVLHGGRIVADGTPRAIACGDLDRWGIEAPLAVRAGRAAGQDPVPLRLEEVAVRPDAVGRLRELLPRPLPAPGGDSPVMEAEDLTCRLEGRTVLAGASFALAPGETLAVVGANGSGKTTLVRHLNGLLRPAGGRILLHGRDIAGRRVSEIARHVGMAFQEPESQFFRFTVREEIASGPEALGCLDPAHIEALADLFRLSPLMDRAPHRLSGGEKKRVAFASAMAARPEVLVLDEPTSGQDAHFREALGALLGRLRERGVSVLLVTHDLPFAEAHAHRWLVLGKGRVLAQGTPAAVMADASAMTAAGLSPTPAFRLARRLEGTAADA